MADTTPSPTSGNPFDLVAYVLFKTRTSLEIPDQPGQAPRWVRIARVRDAKADTDIIAKAVRAAIEGVAKGLTNLVEITLDIREVLVQTDAAKALIELTADFITAATDDNFWRGLEMLVGAKRGDNPLGGVGGVMSDVKNYVGYIPDPDDVINVGNELYRLLCITHLALDGDPAGAPILQDAKHVDVDRSGKFRLLQWAFEQSNTTYGLGPKDNPESTSQVLWRLGARRQWSRTDGALPPRSLVQWGDGDDKETIVDLFFDNRETVVKNRTIDVLELHESLEAMGYRTPAITDKTKWSDDLVLRLRQFQYLNGLLYTGQLDNPTLNRLMNLDFGNKNLRRAKPYDESQLPSWLLPGPEPKPPKPAEVFRLVNGDADHWIDEGSDEITGRDYHYYLVGAPTAGLSPANVRPTGGWISQRGEGYTPAFVAMQSRKPEGKAFHGGVLSEGQADGGGKYFFAARFTEPFKAGRNFDPKENIYGDGTGLPKADSLSTMYQWVILTGIQKPAGWKAYIRASVRQRSLFENRSSRNGLPDQGRLGIEFYGSSVFKLDAADRMGTLRPQPERSAQLDPPQIAEQTIDKKRHFTKWYPTRGEMAAIDMSVPAVEKKRYWVTRELSRVAIPDGAVAMLVILEGRMQAGWDIDAYFDNVEVAYFLEKV